MKLPLSQLKASGWKRFMVWNERFEPELWVDEITPMTILPLFRSLPESPLPQLTASGYERRRALRELEVAFTDRAIALRRHRFE